VQFEKVKPEPGKEISNSRTRLSKAGQHAARKRTLIEKVGLATSGGLERGGASGVKSGHFSPGRKRLYRGGEGLMTREGAEDAWKHGRKVQQENTTFGMKGVNTVK